MVDENNLGPMGPNVISIEPVSELVYSVEGHNFATGFHIEVKDGVGQIVEGATVSKPGATTFTLSLPFATPGPFTLTVINPDARTSTKSFSTPGTSESNSKMRANS